MMIMIVADILRVIIEIFLLFLTGMIEVGKIVLSSYMDIFDIIRRLITEPSTVTYEELALLLVIAVLLIWAIVSIRLVWLIRKDD